MRQRITHAGQTSLLRAVLLAALLALAMGASPARAITVSETVTISSGPNLTINPAFIGLSYEKLQLTRGGYFSSTNTAVIKLFNLLGSGVVRIGAGQADLCNWNGYDHCTPITPAEVNQLAGFMTKVPNWKVIYGLNFASNSAAYCAAEASYVHTALGSQLLGFEIGNEPDEYYLNGLRGTNFTYNNYLAQWKVLKAAAECYGPLVGPATASFTARHYEWTTNFAYDEAAIISLATQHYYRGNARLYTYGDPTAMFLLMTNGPGLPGKISRDVTAVKGDHLSGGLRLDECGSMVNGGLSGVSDAYGSALWSLDFLFTLALNGAQGVNFHGGGKSAYCPIFDNNNGVVSRIGPEFYGLAMFSRLPPGKVRSTTISPAQTFYTAYAVANTTGGFSVLLNNKDTTKTMATSVNLGTNVASAIVFELTGSSWYATNGFTLGGAPINANGSWAGDGQSILSTTNGQLTVNVPPCNAFLVNPVTLGTKPVAVSPGASWKLRGSLTSGPADIGYSYGGTHASRVFMGDWDGTGHMGPGVAFVNSSGQWEWQLRDSDSSGGATYDFAYGEAKPGDTLVVGDWDGNGTWSPGIVRTNAAGQLEWLLSNSHSGGGPSYDFVYGRAGDYPVVGDWDGNGSFTPGIVRGNEWRLRNENTAGTNDVASFSYGNGTTDIPIVGDWDGNGTWTCGLIHNGNTWWLRNENSRGKVEISFGFGGCGDTFCVWK